jgi:hypothetical protein
MCMLSITLIILSHMCCQDTISAAPGPSTSAFNKIASEERQRKCRQDPVLLLPRRIGKLVTDIAITLSIYY